MAEHGGARAPKVLLLRNQIVKGCSLVFLGGPYIQDPTVCGLVLHPLYAFELDGLVNEPSTTLYGPCCKHNNPMTYQCLHLDCLMHAAPYQNPFSIFLGFWKSLGFQRTQRGRSPYLRNHSSIMIVPPPTPQN